MSSSSAASYSSSDVFPSHSGLHLIGAFHVYQVDHIIRCQQSKRRGGPKKATLKYRIIDQQQPNASESLTQHECTWKTITQKNFSNKDNISQYSRNPFGAVRDSSSMLVVHGARSGGKAGVSCISNTVGVNLQGKALSQHPRFLLSSGKGEVGARSTFLFYHTNRNATIELQKLWIEHRELKITIEQYSEDESADSSAGNVPMVSFHPKYKAVYATRENDQSVSASSVAPTLASKPITVKRTSAAVPLSRSSSLMSVLPPNSMPQALAVRLASRKRNFETTLDSPKHEDAGEGQEPEELNLASVKKEQRTDEQSAFATQAQFSGFDSLDEYPLVVDVPMMMISDDLVLEGESSGSETPDSDSEVATPRMDDSNAPAPPSLEQQVSESEESTDGSVSTYNNHDMIVFEQQLNKYEPIMKYEAIIECQSEQQNDSPMMELPRELKEAHLQSGNPFAFKQFDLSSSQMSGFEALKSPFANGSITPHYYQLHSSPPPALYDLDSMQCRKQKPSTPTVLPTASLPRAVHTTITTTSPYAHLFTQQQMCSANQQERPPSLPIPPTLPVLPPPRIRIH